MTDVYNVDVAICPECGNDMEDSAQMSEEAVERLDNGEEGTHYCPTCDTFAWIEDVETRTEYRQMLHHADESSDVLVEIRTSRSPDMKNASTDWYNWIGNQPVPTENYTGIDDTFAEIMEGVDF